MHAAVDHAADTNDIVNLETFDIASHFHNAPYDFVPWHAGIQSVVTLIAGRMQIAVADAGGKNFYAHVICAGITPFKSKRTQRALRIKGCITDTCYHCVSP
jgi:hypothetical protein